MDATKEISAALLLLVALCSFIKEGMCITCYMCNSAPSRNDKACSELKDQKEIFEQDCDLLPEVMEQGVNYTVCRKMFQKIIAPDGEEEHRIIRQCGTEGSIGCDRRTRPNSLQTETCHCDTDLCNAANPVYRPAGCAFVNAVLLIALALFQLARVL